MKNQMNPEERDAPLYSNFKELFSNGFSLDAGTCIFLASVHSSAIGMAVWLFGFAPAQWMWLGALWMIVHLIMGSVATTLYSHRLITHNAAQHVSTPVHWFFCAFAQIFSVQGSVKQWSANHSLHHGVDRHGKKQIDPYSATWFNDPIRNFLWSHTLCHCFNHPKSDEYTRSHNAKRHAVIMWQDKWYGLLTTFWIFLVPMGVGFAIGGWYGFFALTAGSLLGTVLVQHNTWTVNSVTHMWGFTDGISSSAQNNYIWLGPMGEGNHHGDHHDYPRDYRNGFGVSGWLLDPTRYLILALRGLRLLKGLNRASKKEEAEIIAERKLASVSSRFSTVCQETRSIVEQLEGRAHELRQDWIEAVARWEKLKKESGSLAAAGKREITRDITVAWRHVKASRQAFYEAVDRLQKHPVAYSG